MTKVKICGMTRTEDIEAAVELGASAVGFVLEPSSPRFVSLFDVESLLEAVPPFVTAVGVLGRFEKEHVYRLFNTIQAIGVRLSDLEAHQRAISVFRPGSGDPMPQSDDCSAILVDAFSTEGFGGTGKRVELQTARDVMMETTRPVILAGGLRPESVGSVIAELQPYAVDVSSGVEVKPGVKDRGAMKAFFESVKEADARAQHKF